MWLKALNISKVFILNTPRTVSAQRVVFFQYQVGYTEKKSRVAGGLGRVFLTTLFTLGYSPVIRVLSLFWRQWTTWMSLESYTWNTQSCLSTPKILGHLKYWVSPKYQIIPDILGYLLPHDFQIWMWTGLVSRKILGTLGHQLGWRKFSFFTSILIKNISKVLWK